jgi:Uma2 family endonuclease
MSVAYEHAGPWTVDDVLALPDDGNRYEVVDGALIVNPPPSPEHQDASYRLHTLLDAAARVTGASVRIWEAVGIRLPDGQMLVPDVVVATADGPRKAWPLLEPSEVLLVVEVVSPGSTARDRTEKPYLYAEAGIPRFWRIELGTFRGRTEPLPVLLAHALDDAGEYRLEHRAGAGTSVRLAQPFPADLDPGALVP